MSLLGGLVGAPSSIRRKITATILGVALVSAGVAFVVRGGGNDNIIHRWEVQRKGGGYPGSGSTVAYMTSSGTLALSGSLRVARTLTVDGVLISTGSNLYYAAQGLSLSSNVFFLSSSFTGSSLEIFGTSSGRQIYAADILRSSGSLTVDGLTILKNTLEVQGVGSGRILHAQDELSSSGSLNVEGVSNFHGTASGNLIRVSTISPLRMQGYFQSGSMLISSGSLQFMIPQYASGWNLVGVQFDVRTAGTTNATKVQLRQLDKAGRNMLSTPVQVDSAELSSLTAATPYVINTSNDDVSAGEMITVDVTALSSTAPKDPSILIELAAP